MNMDSVIKRWSLRMPPLSVPPADWMADIASHFRDLRTLDTELVQRPASIVHGVYTLIHRRIIAYRRAGHQPNESRVQALRDFVQYAKLA